MRSDFDVVVVGAGAAGLAAGLRLARSGLTSLVLEASSRPGGRALTVAPRADLPLDLGCGWLHSADVNPLSRLAEGAGFILDPTPPAWSQQSGNQDFSAAEQAQFQRAFAAFEEPMAAAAKSGEDRPARELLEPGCRWNVLIEAVSTYYNGVEHDGVSVLDYGAYQDTDVNWRITQGYGAAILALTRGVEVVTDCAVTRIDHGGRRVRLSTSKGELEARAVILTLPTPLIAGEHVTFTPALPAKAEAAAGLPLGLADKAFLLLDETGELPREGHFFGRIDRIETGSYHLRPFGRPVIEAFIGGRNAWGLEGEGPGAMAAFAIEELKGLMGSDFARGLRPLLESAWGREPFILGAYSHALPGRAGAREVLAEPTAERLFWAGEATHPSAFSTAHGAWESGVRAAEEALAVLVPA